MMKTIGNLHNLGIEFVDLFHDGTMMTDKNRNNIAHSFLESEADWLFWVDADNINPIPALRRLLDTAKAGKRTLVAGLYFGKAESKGYPPIAYDKTKRNMYKPIEQWERGEILLRDAAGMNSVLSHKSVYEDLEVHYITLQKASGGLITVHRDDIIGDIFESESLPTDGKVIDGVLYERMWIPEEPINTMFFALEYGRTEDMGFFEKCQRLGHILWIDTSVEAGHLTLKNVTGAEHRAANTGEVRRCCCLENCNEHRKLQPVLLPAHSPRDSKERKDGC
jgi:hypothetical protein